MLHQQGRSKSPLRNAQLYILCLNFCCSPSNILTSAFQQHPLTFSPTDWLEARAVKPWAFLDCWSDIDGADLHLHNNLHLSAKGFLSAVNLEWSLGGCTQNGTLPLFSDTGWGGGAENCSAVCIERKVNLLRQFAETDYASLSKTALTLMAPITGAQEHMLWAHSCSVWRCLLKASYRALSFTTAVNTQA